MNNRKNKKAARIVAILVAAAMLLMTFFYVFAMTGWFGSAMQKSGLIVNAATDNEEIPLEYRVDALEELVLEIQLYYKDKVALETLFNGAYQGLLESLDDPWSVFYPSNETAAQLIKNIQGEYGGVGRESLSMRERWIPR